MLTEAICGIAQLHLQVPITTGRRPFRSRNSFRGPVCFKCGKKTRVYLEASNCTIRCTYCGGKIRGQGRTEVEAFQDANKTSSRRP